MLLADQDHAHSRVEVNQTLHGAEAFGNPLVGFQEAEDADEWVVLAETEASAPGVAVDFGNPGAVRDFPNRQRKAGPLDLVDEIAAVDD